MGNSKNKQTKDYRLGQFQNGLATVYKKYGNEWRGGYINTSGEEVIDCKFKYADYFNEYGYARVENDADKWGVIDRSGNYVVEPEYEGILMSENSPLVCVYTDFLYENGRRIPDFHCLPKVVNPKYGGRILGEFKQVGCGIRQYGNKGLMPVKNDNGKWGLINEEGDLALPFQYDLIECDNLGRCENDITGDYFKVTLSGSKIIKEYIFGECIHYRDGKKGLITTDGRVVLDFKYDELYYVSDDCIIVGKGEKEQGRKFGVITLKGKTILPCKYSYVHVSDNIICFEDWDSYKCGWADMRGNILIEPKFYQYGWLTGFSDGLMCVKKRKFRYKGKVGFVDKQGELVIPFKFDIRWNPLTCMDSFYDGLAAYGIDADTPDIKYGWINKSGEFVIPPIYHTVHTRFGEDGLIPARLNGERFYIDRTGTRCLF